MVDTLKSNYFLTMPGQELGDFLLFRVHACFFFHAAHFMFSADYLQVYKDEIAIADSGFDDE